MNSNDVFDNATRDRITQCGIIAVLVIDDPDDAVPVAHALLDGGVEAMELTLRTPAALTSLRNIQAHVPHMLAGVGTILTVKQVRDVGEANAAFGVAPGMNRKVVEAAIEAGLSFGPGIVTPSEIEQALELGCRLLKFFPAEPSGGLAYLKSMAAPYLHLDIRYVPLGGINAENLTSYIESPLIAAVGGSWIATRDLIRQKDWDTITRNARDATKLVAQARA